MEVLQESSNTEVLPALNNLRKHSSSSSIFLSANQTPFFSPKSPTSYDSLFNELIQPNDLVSNTNDQLFTRLESLYSGNVPSTSNDDGKEIREIPVSSSHSGIICSSTSDGNEESTECCSQRRGKYKAKLKNWKKFTFARNSVSLSSASRLKTYDVYIGFHGRKPSLLRFVNWLGAELELYGISCFAADRAHCRCSRSQDAIKKAMNVSTYGVIILTKSSFANPHCIEELKNFLDKKSLVPIYFNLSASACLARDIIEQKGELWEKHGGELWRLYAGPDNEWREALNRLNRMDDSKLEAHNQNWRNCILNAVILLATRMGRRGTVARVSRWKEKVDREELPFPRNTNFVGRAKELSELEKIFFADVINDVERECLEQKRRRRRKHIAIQSNETSQKEESSKHHQSEGSSSKGKELVTQSESLENVELSYLGNPDLQVHPVRAKRRKSARKRKSKRTSSCQRVVCVSGDMGIGKTELVLEYAYRFLQRYKMVLWVGGESRYIRQNYLNLSSLLEIDLSMDHHSFEKGRIKRFEKHEKEALSKVRKEFTGDIPFLVIIDNLEDVEDWWDKKNVMDLLPFIGGQTHFIITTRLPQVMNLEPMRLSFLSCMEAIALMKGTFQDYPVAEVDALRVIEERLGRLSLGLGIVGSILSELPISPSRLLNTINRMPLRDLTWTDHDIDLRRHTFFLQLLEVCFSIFSIEAGPDSLATKMVHLSVWFAPTTVPIQLLGFAANKIPSKHHFGPLWRKCFSPLSCCSSISGTMKPETEAASLLVRYGMARKSSNSECIRVHDLVKLLARKRGSTKTAQAMVQCISLKGSLTHHSEHLWAACFLLFEFGGDPIVIEMKPSDLIPLVKHIVLPLAVNTFITYSRCNATLKLLSLCTESLEIAEESLSTRPEPHCGGQVKPSSQHNSLSQELALLRATVLETRTKLLLRGGQFDLGEDLIGKAIYLRTSIHGEQHPDTLASQETLSKLIRLRTNTRFT